MLLGSRIEKVESSLWTLKERRVGGGAVRRGGGSGVDGKLYEKIGEREKKKGLALSLWRCGEMSKRNSI